MPFPPPPRHGYLLAGGKSSRMGENKAFVDFHGRPLLERALTTLNGACESVAIVGDPRIFSAYGPVVADVFPGCGPLAGIHSALLHSSADLNLILAVDMPFVSQELLRFLLDLAESTAAAVTVPRTSKGLQPLCAVYRRAFVSAAEHSLREGKYKIDATFATVPPRVVEESELQAAGFSEKNFLNMNTPEDRRAAEGLSSQT
jgi:molybdopterin-guanine dinucleotide biosynthesis protein A